MMEFLKEWIEQLTIAVIIVSIFELLLPKGKLKKYIKIVLGLYIVFCIIAPFVNNKNLFKLEDENIYVNTSESQIKQNIDQTTMDMRLEELYKQEMEKKIQEYINKYNYNLIKCKINADLNKSSANPGIHSIDLKLKERGISNIEKVEISEKQDREYQNEGIENLKKEISTEFEISKDIINIKIVR